MNFDELFCNVFCWNNYGIIRTKNKPKKLFGQISRWSQFVTKSWLKWCDFYGFKSCPTWHVASILSTLATAKLNKEYLNSNNLCRHPGLPKDQQKLTSQFVHEVTFCFIQLFNFISHSSTFRMMVSRKVNCQSLTWTCPAKKSDGKKMMTNVPKWRVSFSLLFPLPIFPCTLF